MKYIRTKDGIYEVAEEEIDSVIVYENGWKDKSSAFLLHISKKKIIKQANTIVELCDEFIVVKIDEEHKKENLIFGYWLTARINAVKGEDLYGAIWTDKGLIFVAKMNEKGEFELL